MGDVGAMGGDVVGGARVDSVFHSFLPSIEQEKNQLVSCASGGRAGGAGDAAADGWRCTRRYGSGWRVSTSYVHLNSAHLPHIAQHAPRQNQIHDTRPRDHRSNTRHDTTTEKAPPKSHAPLSAGHSHHFTDPPGRGSFSREHLRVCFAFFCCCCLSRLNNVHYSLLTTHYSLLTTTHYSLLTSH